MDPDETLAIIRDAIEQGHDLSRPLSYRNISLESVAEYFGYLDVWLTNGGFLPDDWTQR